MSDFWSGWIIILTSVTLIGIVWVLFANRKSTGNGPNKTTGHSHDGIEEYDNPLPAWWLYLFVGTIVFGIGYLIYYPGMGSFSGTANWTQHKQWQQEVARAEQRYGAVFAEYAAMDIDAIIHNKKALKMGRRLFANNCAQCHGSDAQGSFGFPNLSDNDWLYGNDAAQVKYSIAQGRTAVMPGWQAALGDSGVAEVTEYVVSLSAAHTDSDTATLDAALVSAGQAHFQMFCVACHGVEGKGNPLFGAPNLTDNIWLYGSNRADLKFSISKGRSGQMPAHELTLSGDKIQLLTAYVLSLSRDSGKD